MCWNYKVDTYVFIAEAYPPTKMVVIFGPVNVYLLDWTFDAGHVNLKYLLVSTLYTQITCNQNHNHTTSWIQMVLFGKVKNVNVRL